MHGSYLIRVRNNRNSYSFTLRRNLTVLRGASGRGKTTLFEMIHEHNRFGKNSGVSISCDKSLFALVGDDWESQIRKHPDTIIVIDEDSSFIRSNDFAAAVRGSDNYFLLITRNYLTNLPISVDEIFEISGSKNKKFTKIYQETDRMFDRPSRRLLPFRPEIIITEDSGAGFQFFRHIANRLGLNCYSAEGKTKIFDLTKQYYDKNTVVIADSAAFGPEMEDIVDLQRLRPRNLAIFLPESFEWLILKSNVISGIEPERIDRAELYADSVNFMSWEQYFTKVLIDATREYDYLRYSKSSLNNFYLEDKNNQKITDTIKGLDLAKR